MGSGDSNCCNDNTGICSCREQAFKVTPARLFKGLVADNHNLVPKIAPQFIKSAKIIEGDGGVGSIIQVFLTDAAPFKYKIDTLDESQFLGKYTIIEGGDLNGIAKCSSFELKVEPTTAGGFLSNLKATFTLSAELSQNELGGYVKKGEMICDGVEGFLLKNPNVYA